MYPCYGMAETTLMMTGSYALEDTVTPVVVSILSIVINIASGIVLSQNYGVVGLAAAFSIASIIQFTALYFILRQRMKHLLERYPKKFSPHRA